MKPSPRLKRVLDAGEPTSLVIPPLVAYLETGGLPNPFHLQIRGGSGEVPPDGWFHPSSHPLMEERQLYYYLTAPDQWDKEPFPFPARISTIMGSMMHEVVERALTDLGLLVPVKGICIACGLKQPSECREHGAIDPITGSRGHVDGILLINGVRRHFEFKSASPMTLKDLKNCTPEIFKAKWPYYYSQHQEYLRLLGLKQSIVLFMGMGYPWTFKEFHLDYDPEYSLRLERKYLKVRQAVEEGVPPEPCCAPKSAMARKCPATACPVKKAS